MEQGLDIRTYCLGKLEVQRQEMLIVRRMAQPKVKDAINKRIAVLNEIFNFSEPIELREVKPRLRKSAPFALYQ